MATDRERPPFCTKSHRNLLNSFVKDLARLRNTFQFSIVIKQVINLQTVRENRRYLVNLKSLTQCLPKIKKVPEKMGKVG